MLPKMGSASKLLFYCVRATLQRHSIRTSLCAPNCVSLHNSGVDEQPQAKFCHTLNSNFMHFAHQ